MMTWTAMGQGKTKNLRARLSGYQEVPAVSTEGSGEFRGRIDPRDTEMAYDLSYSGLRGNVTMAHIHFANTGTNGPIMIWLCGTATNPGPAGTPTCPQQGTVSRTVSAADVIGPAGQGIPPGDFAQAGGGAVVIHGDVLDKGRGRLARAQAGKLVLEVLDSVNRTVGTTTAVITHNVVIAAMADRVIHFSDGRIHSIDSNASRKSPRELSW